MFKNIAALVIIILFSLFDLPEFKDMKLFNMYKHTVNMIYQSSKKLYNIDMVPTSYKICMPGLDACNKYFMPESFKFIISKIPELGDTNNYSDQYSYVNFISECSKLSLNDIKDCYHSFHHQVLLCSKLEASNKFKVKGIIRSYIPGIDYKIISEHSNKKHSTSKSNTSMHSKSKYNRYKNGVCREYHIYTNNSPAKYLELLSTPLSSYKNKKVEEIIILTSYKKKYNSFNNIVHCFECFGEYSNNLVLYNNASCFDV